MVKIDRIRERIEAVIDPNYMRDNGLVPNEVVFFIFDILKSEGIDLGNKVESDT